MRKPSYRQIKYATDISNALQIPLPDQAEMVTYATYIAGHLSDYYSRLDENMSAAEQPSVPETTTYRLPGVEARMRLQSIDDMVSETPIVTPEDAVSFIKKYMRDMAAECLIVINLNNAGQAINYSRVAIGTINAAFASAADIYKTAILSNAAKILLAHNHLSASCKPSREDKMMTVTIAQAGQIMGIPLLDHIITCSDPGTYYSFQESEPALLENVPAKARFPEAV